MPGRDSSPLDMILSESREISLVVQNDEDNEGVQSAFGGEHSPTVTAPDRSQDPLPSSCGERSGVCMRGNNTVAVVIPAARPPKPRTKRRVKRPYRRPPKVQTPRTAPFDESDETCGSDDDDDDDYVERTPQFDNRYRPTKKPRQLPVTNSDRSNVGAVVGFQLGGLSLPDLRTVQRGVLTCEFFPSQIMYSFSWAEERQCSDDLSTKVDPLNRGYNRHDMNTTQKWESYASSKDETDKQHDNHLSAREAVSDKSLKRKNKWTPEANAHLKQLKDKDKLLWSQIQKHFPNRTEGAIKVHYYTVLKNSAVMSCVPTSHAHSERGSSFLLSPEPVLQNHTQHPLDTVTERTSRSRPVRARRAVERYSP